MKIMPMACKTKRIKKNQMLYTRKATEIVWIIYVNKHINSNNIHILYETK